MEWSVCRSGGGESRQYAGPGRCGSGGGGNGVRWEDRVMSEVAGRRDVEAQDPEGGIWDGLAGQVQILSGMHYNCVGWLS